MPRTAGRKVRAPYSEAPTTIAPPMPNERRAGASNSSSPDKPMATAMPENVTAFPAVPTMISTASPTVRPRRNSSLNRLTMNSE